MRERPPRNDLSDQVLAQLREFNQRGLAAIAELSAAAVELRQRIEALEEFARGLSAPGDKAAAQ